MKSYLAILLLIQSCQVNQTHSTPGIEYRNDASIVQMMHHEPGQDRDTLLNTPTKNENTPKSNNVSKTQSTAATPQDSLLRNIQQKVKQASSESFVSKTSKPLDMIIEALGNRQKNSKQNLNLYWQAYALYYKCIVLLQVKDNSGAEKSLDTAIEILEQMERKNADDFALLGLIKGLSFQFKSGVKAPFISKEIKNHIESALELDSLNIRAYYVKGSNDYYTPKNFGGRKNVEQLLKKAISLPEQVVPSIYLPSWGKEEAYEMLIKFYIEEQRWDDAKKYFADANAKYPNNYMINQLALKLVGK